MLVSCEYACIRQDAATLLFFFLKCSNLSFIIGSTIVLVALRVAVCLGHTVQSDFAVDISIFLSIYFLRKAYPLASPYFAYLQFRTPDVVCHHLAGAPFCTLASNLSKFTFRACNSFNSSSSCVRT